MLEPGLHTVIGLQAEIDDFELELADRGPG